MIEIKKQSFSEMFSVYLDKRMLKILLLGAISGAATSISNVGPGLGSIIGPNGNFSSLPDVSKWILTFGMILGRLELFAILVLFLPSFWRN